MKTELIVLNSEYGIEKIAIEPQQKTIELSINSMYDDSNGDSLRKQILMHKKMLSSYGEYSADSFSITLSKPNHILIKGDIAKAVYTLKKIGVDR